MQIYNYIFLLFTSLTDYFSIEIIIINKKSPTPTSRTFTVWILSQQLIQVTGSGNCDQAPAKQVGGSGGGRWLRVTITPRAARAISFSSITRARRIRILRNVRVDFLLFPFPKKAACHYQNKFNDLFYLFHLSVCFKGVSIENQSLCSGNCNAISLSISVEIRISMRL